MRTPEQVAVDVVEKREGRVIYPMTQIAKGNILSATLAVRSRDAEWREELKRLLREVHKIPSHQRRSYFEIELTWILDNTKASGKGEQR